MYLPNINKHIMYVIIANKSIQIPQIGGVSVSPTVFIAVKLGKTGQWLGFGSNNEYNMNLWRRLSKYAMLYIWLYTLNLFGFVRVSCVYDCLL